MQYSMLANLNCMRCCLQPHAMLHASHSCLYFAHCQPFPRSMYNQLIRRVARSTYHKILDVPSYSPSTVHTHHILICHSQHNTAAQDSSQCSTHRTLPRTVPAFQPHRHMKQGTSILGFPSSVRMWKRLNLNFKSRRRDSELTVGVGREIV